MRETRNKSQNEVVIQLDTFAYLIWMIQLISEMLRRSTFRHELFDSAYVKLIKWWFERSISKPTFTISHSSASRFSKRHKKICFPFADAELSFCHWCIWWMNCTIASNFVQGNYSRKAIWISNTKMLVVSPPKDDCCDFFEKTAGCTIVEFDESGIFPLIIPSLHKPFHLNSSAPVLSNTRLPIRCCTSRVMRGGFGKNSQPTTSEMTSICLDIQLSNIFLLHLSDQLWQKKTFVRHSQKIISK